MLALTQISTCSVELNGHTVDLSISRTTRGAEPVLLLHGIQTNKDVFVEWHRSDLGRDRDFIAIDFPGFGKSDKPQRLAYTIDTFAASCVAVADKLGIGRFHVVGHSLGGMVGTQLLTQSGGRILSLASLEGNLKTSDCGTSATLVGSKLEDFRRTGYQELQDSVQVSNSPSASLRVAALKLTPPDVFLATAEDIVRISASMELEGIFLESPIPKLMIVGAESGFHSRPSSDFSKTVEIPGTSHFMLLENPTATMKAVSDFWASL